MLEIALEIIICLLLAALIGFALGYLVAKGLSEKSQPVTDTQTEPETNDSPDSPGKEEKEEKEVKTEELSVEEAPSEETLVVEEPSNASEEVEIPTENVIGEALEALEALEDIEEVPETAKEEAEIDQKPELLSQPRNGEKDDLTAIKGIGPKAEEKLNAVGIYHIDQIANWTEDNMIWLEENTLFTARGKKEAWRTEAKALIS